MSWFEAQAYTRWLQSQLPIFGYGKKWLAALPTELQWECAARFGLAMETQPSAYPWNGEPATWKSEVNEFAQYANLGELVGHPTTVGLYPKGHSREQLADVVGNVWEWGSHRYVNNGNPNLAIEEQNASGNCALRGGAWIVVPEVARCSFCGSDNPEHWSDDIGFRVVLSLAD